MPNVNGPRGSGIDGADEKNQEGLSNSFAEARGIDVSTLRC